MVLDEFFGPQQSHRGNPLSGRYHHVAIHGDRVIVSRGRKSSALGAEQSASAIALLRSGFMPRGMGKSSATVIWGLRP